MLPHERTRWTHVSVSRVWEHLKSMYGLGPVTSKDETEGGPPLGWSIAPHVPEAESRSLGSEMDTMTQQN